MPPVHTVFQEPPQEKILYSKVGRPSRPSDVAEMRDNSSEHCCTFQRSIATDHTKWRPLLYRSPSRQPQQAIALAQYSNLKCVSRLRATQYHAHSYSYYIKQQTRLIIYNPRNVLNSYIFPGSSLEQRNISLNMLI